MNTPKTLEKGISNLVGCLTDPILVSPGGWGDTLPEWIKSQITLERLAESMASSRERREPAGTDAEATAYLYSASLEAPMDHDWTNIYLYVAGKTYARANRSGEVPEDIRVDSLNDEQMADLNRLKEWIYRQRTRARQEGARAERRRAKEEEAKRKAEQPALFQF